MDDMKKKYISEEDDATIDLVPLLEALLRNWLVIAVVTVALAAAAFVGAKMLITPTYQSGFTAYVNNRVDSENQTALTNADLSASRYLTYTYAEIMDSRTVLEQAAEYAGLEDSYSRLSSMVTTEIVSDTEIIAVYVVHPDPAVAKSFADAIAEVATEQVAAIVDGSSMRIIDHPVLPKGIYSPSYTRIAIIGALLGFLLSAGIIILRTVLDDRVKDEESLETRFGIPILGTIPNTSSAASAGGSYYSYGYGDKQNKGGNK